MIEFKNFILQESKIGALTDHLKGSYVMGDNGLADYHAAREAINASRSHTLIKKLHGIKVALKNHRVQVAYDPDQDNVRIHSDKGDYHL